MSEMCLLSCLISFLLGMVTANVVFLMFLRAQLKRMKEKMER